MGIGYPRFPSNVDLGRRGVLMIDPQQGHTTRVVRRVARVGDDTNWLPRFPDRIAAR